jgi:hypothetical protein
VKVILYIKNGWFATTDIPEEYLVIFRGTESGITKTLSIPLEDLEDYDIEEEE